MTSPASASANELRAGNVMAALLLSGCALGVVEVEVEVDDEFWPVELVADGQPTPMYVARIILAACSARP